MSRFALRSFITFIAVGLFFANPAWAQRRSQILTLPSTPKATQLEALNLEKMWSIDLPMVTKQDGIHDAWVVGGQVLLQTRRGTVVCIDAETGRELWHTLPGLPFQVTLNLAWNNRHVFAFNNGNLYSINRRTGQIDWRFQLGVTPSAPAVADNKQLFLPIEGEAMVAIYLPQPPEPPTKKKRLIIDEEPRARVGGGRPPEKKTGEKPNDALAAFAGAFEPAVPKPDGNIPGGDLGDKPKPAPLTDPKAPGTLRTIEDDIKVLGEDDPVLNPMVNWMFPTNGIIPFRPLITKDFVQGINYQGETFTATKVGNPITRTTLENKEVNLKINGRVVVQPVQHNKTTYLATDDGAVYAVDIDLGEKLWERTLSFAPERPLFCTEDDLFVITRNGLTRLEARTGKIGWTVNQGTNNVGYQLGMHNVVAVNPKFVYAFDRPGKLHIFERKLGRELANVDWADFNVPIPNFSNDRLLLASHSGKLVCLRDREYLLPEFHGKGENVMEDPAAQRVAVDILSQPSLLQASEGMVLRDVLAQVSSRHRLRIFFSDGAFRDLNLQPIADKVVKVVPAANMPLGKHLETILTPLGATVANLGGVMMVVPKPGAEAVAPPEAKPGDQKPAAPPEGGEPEKKPEDPADPAADPKPAPEKPPAKPKPGNKPAPKPGLPASPPDAPKPPG